MLILLVFLHLLKFLVILFPILRYLVSFKNEYGNKYLPIWGWDSLVGVAPGYRLDGLGIESLWKRDFSHTSRPALGPIHLLYNGYWVFPGGKGARAWC
jgi:hypothetical protein